MANTIHISKLMKQSDDIFELVLLASKRAKQINALRMAKYPLPTISKRTEEEDYEETPPEYSVDWDGMEKATTIGLNELLDGQIIYKRVVAEKKEVTPETDKF